MQIGKIAEQTGLSIDAIRFYEKQRLLERPPRSEGGFRLFNSGDIQRIQFIRSAQQLGFSLPEIRELLVLQRAGGEACSHMRDLLRDKVAELGVLEAHLKKSLRRCERNLKQSGECQQDACPVLHTISQGGS